MIAFDGSLADIAGVRLTFDLPPEVEKAGYTRITRAVLNPGKLEALGWPWRLDSINYEPETGLIHYYWRVSAYG